MASEVRSLANDKIAIICTRHDNNNNTYTLVPRSVAIGKVDDDFFFHLENGENVLPPIDRIEYITDSKKEEFYAYCDTIANLSAKYQETDANKVALKYYMEIASHLNIALVDGDLVKLYHQDYSVISNEIQGKISKHYEKSAKEDTSQVNINKKATLHTNVDLAHIDKDDLARFLKSHIFENDSIIDDIATVIAMNYSAKKREEIISMLSIGNTGSGKTETYRLISEYLGVPFTMFDCSSMSDTGYQGDSVEDLIKAIYNNSREKPQLMSKSIVVLEEIDKIASRGHGVADINVQYELLKFLDGFTFHVNLDKALGIGQKVSVDTTFMTKAGLGAFEEMFERKLKDQRKMGFDKWGSGPIEINDKDMEEYGMTKQIIRRFLLTFLYKDLNRDDLKRILTLSKSSPLLIKKERYYRDFNTILEYTEEYIDAIIDYALTLNSGAGGLNKAVAKSLIKADSAVYNRLANNDKSKKRLLVTGETFENPCKFTY
ncbi:MAG: AAA family ATPase [Bacilli bacterium]|nr:AAA family ATPase [Bacilli bacterium]